MRIAAAADALVNAKSPAYGPYGDLFLDRDVALKVPRFALHAALRERFLREAKTAARLRHPKIVIRLLFSSHHFAP
jgi:hypothetical protein